MKAIWKKVSLLLVIGVLIVGLNLGGSGGCKGGGGSQQGTTPTADPTGKTPDITGQISQGQKSTDSEAADVFISGFAVPDSTGTTQARLEVTEGGGSSEFAALQPSVGTTCPLGGTVITTVTPGSSGQSNVTLRYSACKFTKCGEILTADGNAAGSITITPATASTPASRVINIATGPDPCTGGVNVTTSNGIVAFGFNITKTSGQQPAGTICGPSCAPSPNGLDLQTFRTVCAPSNSCPQGGGSAGTSGSQPPTPPPANSPGGFLVGNNCTSPTDCYPSGVMTNDVICDNIGRSQLGNTGLITGTCRMSCSSPYCAGGCPANPLPGDPNAGYCR
ncbi:MAG: hypothetical protein HY073_05835 [Deltaproteobacteria bacterium]|nr:hypothetical protein [Deltaproteobacteria bacterium]